MTVYVDDSNIRASVPNGNHRVNGVWCHMMADATEELLALAESIGLKPAWLQSAGTPKEHFDVTATKKRQALRAGAVPITWRESVELVRARRRGETFDLAAARGQLL